MATKFVTSYRRPVQGVDASNPSKVEVRAHGRIVIDGVDFDYRYGMDHGESVWFPSNYLTALQDGADFIVNLMLEVDPEEDMPSESTVDYGDDDIPAYPVWPDGETQAAQTISSTDATSLAAASTLAKKKAAAWRSIYALRAWHGQLKEEGVSHPASEGATGHDFLVYDSWGVYLIFHSAYYSDDQIIAWANANASGASDCTNARQFYEKVHDLLANQKPSANTPLIFAAPSNATRFTLSGIVNGSSLEFAKTSIWGSTTLDLSDTDIMSGAWIDDLT